MILFLYDADVVLAHIPFGLGRVVNVVVGEFTPSRDMVKEVY